MRLVVAGADEAADKVRLDLQQNLRWMRTKRGLTQTDLALLASVSGKTIANAETGVREPYPSTVGHIALGTVNHYVRIVSELAGVDLHPHRFRHTALTNGYRRTRNLLAVQELAGHADPRTTRNYIDLDWGDIEAVAAAL